MSRNDQERPHVFVGSSAEGLGVANSLQVLLDYDVEVEIWNQGTFEPGGTSLESLVRSARTFDFAVLVVTPDDAIQSRGETRNVTRDNVLFELGLFMGALGKERVYMLFDRANRPDLPSDLAGVTPVTYALHSSGNLRASLGAASTQLTEVFTRLGRREAQRTEMELSQPSFTTAGGGVPGIESNEALEDSETDRNAQSVEAELSPEPFTAANSDTSPADSHSAAAGGPSTGSQTNGNPTAAQPTVTEVDIEQVAALVREKRMSYSSATAFYRDFEAGRWLVRFNLPPIFRSATAREQLKRRWLREADFTRSWDHSNIVLMQLELVADQLTTADIDNLLDLPTEDAQGHNQEAGLWSFLEFLERRDENLLSDKARKRLIEFRRE